tara:strand:- start:613 stop:744 length:132 start_codon:yes stop_codon:yes gene_type:complete
MAKKEMYRINSLPGIKECIDYMRSAKNSSTKQKPKVENKKTKY